MPEIQKQKFSYIFSLPTPPPPLAAFTPLAEHTGTSTTCSFSLVNRHVDFFLASSFQPGEMNAFVSLLMYNLIAPLCENIKNKLSLLFSGPIHHFHLSKTKSARFYSRIYLFYLPCNDRGWLNILKLHIFLRTEVNEVGRDINVFFQSWELSVLMARDSETLSSPFSVSMPSGVKCGPLFYFLSCSEVHTKMPELTLLHLRCLLPKEEHLCFWIKATKEDKIRNIGFGNYTKTLIWFLFLFMWFKKCCMMSRFSLLNLTINFLLWSYFLSLLLKELLYSSFILE